MHPKFIGLFSSYLAYLPHFLPSLLVVLVSHVRSFRPLILVLIVPEQAITLYVSYTEPHFHPIQKSPWRPSAHLITTFSYLLLPVLFKPYSYSPLWYYNVHYYKKFGPVSPPLLLQQPAYKRHVLDNNLYLPIPL